MSQYDKVLDIYKRLKIDLSECGVTIGDDKRVSNGIIMAIAEAMANGIEIGEVSGRNKAIEDLESYISEMKEKY